MLVIVSDTRKSSWWRVVTVCCNRPLRIRLGMSEHDFSFELNLIHIQRGGRGRGRGPYDIRFLQNIHWFTIINTGWQHICMHSLLNHCTLKNGKLTCFNSIPAFWCNVPLHSFVKSEAKAT